MREQKFRGRSRFKLSYKDDEALEISICLISLISKVLRKFGLNFKRIGRYLHMKENKIHSIIVEIERFNYKIIEKALKVFVNKRTNKNKQFKRRTHGLFPLEFYLTEF